MNAHLQSKLYTAMNPNTKSKKSATTEFIATKTNTASTGKDTQTMKTVGSAMTTSTPQTFSDNSTPNIQRQALLQRRGGCNGSCGNSKLRFAEPQQTRSQHNHTLSAPRKLSSRNHRLLAITALFSQSPRSPRNHRSLLAITVLSHATHFLRRPTPCATQPLLCNAVGVIVWCPTGRTVEKDPARGYS